MNREAFFRAHIDRAMTEIKKLRSALIAIRDRSDDHEDAMTMARETLEDLEHDIEEASAAWRRGE